MDIYNDFPLSKVLWYKVGGTAKYFLPATSKADVLRAIDFIEKEKPNRLFICGQGSNLIFSDDYFDGAVLQIASPKKEHAGVIQKGENELESFSGVILDNLIQASFEHKLTGLEWAGGLPGTVGAGVRGNVGAFGGEIKDSFISAEILTLTDNAFTLSRKTHEMLNFSYRHSLIKENKNMIVVSALFRFHPATDGEIEKAKQIYDKNILYRKTNHPIEYPTCGSVFKNINKPEQVEKILAVWPDIEDMVKEKWHGKVSMGYIIKRLGFVSYRVGNMEVSSKHANFIINLGDAKAKDATTIISHIQEKVGETFGFKPEVEVEIVV